MAAVARGRWLPRAWLCRRAGPGCGRHYRAALCAELKQPLAIKEVASRPVRPHEVRVDVHFCGVNFADILVCRGQYQEKPQLPFTPGMEFSGTVLETGTDVSIVKEGDRVIGVSGFNGMAEECVIDQKALWQIPERVPLREAAALPVSYGTAVLALEHRARTRPGETVLVTAAAGATGLAVIDVATNVLQAQVFVIAAAGSDEKCKLAMQKGAQSTVNYSQGSLKEAVRKLVGSAGVNVAIDTVGGDVFLEALRRFRHQREQLSGSVKRNRSRGKIRKCLNIEKQDIQLENIQKMTADSLVGNIECFRNYACVKFSYAGPD
ncbi:quinone oxidoreductase-like protein 2 isoform X4 [Lutra lutra]|uniref:quinone oxidoreductase-like protein 2 isoform X4 n=1 Tax=Lutra lutra TaxID=9657 RepID=UPI001FD5E574|nr:quinone oxidoreductase-like protein 2 isoform X4 [Lutra lutra]